MGLLIALGFLFGQGSIWGGIEVLTEATLKGSPSGALFSSASGPLTRVISLFRSPACSAV